MQVSLKILGRLFSNLMVMSENIAIAMKARGFVGPKDHKIVFSSQQRPATVPNIVAALLMALTLAAYWHSAV